MYIKRPALANAERELEAAIGILKLKKSGSRMNTWSEKIKKTPYQVRVLQELFKVTEFPSTATRKDLALLLSIPQRSIQVWFQNTRQAKKKYRDVHIDRNAYSSGGSDAENEDVSLCQLVDIIRCVRYRAH